MGSHILCSKILNFAHADMLEWTACVHNCSSCYIYFAYKGQGIFQQDLILIYNCKGKEGKWLKVPVQNIVRVIKIKCNWKLIVYFHKKV